MNSRANIKLTNNLRTVFLIVLFASTIAYLIFTVFGWTPPKTFTFAIACILYPITTMQKSRESLKSAAEMKDISTEEMARLRYISSARAKNILHTIIFYIISASLTAILSASSFGSPHVATIAASFIIGILTAAIYSTYVAYLESDEVSDFKSKIQERINRKISQDAFNKRLVEASKSK